MTSRAGTLPRVLFHTALLFALPFLVGGLTGLFVEVSQVRETFAGLVRFAATLLLPVMIAQAVGIAVKVRRERAARRAAGPLTPGETLEVIDRHVRVMTDKGVGLFVAGLACVTLSLGFKFAELGIIAILGLSTLYLTVAVGVLVSTFVVARFEDRLASRGGSIGREFSPVVVEAGDSVEERFHFERVPVPPGFNLVVHQTLPARLATESRHAVGNDVSLQRITLSRALRRTPRGRYDIGPADIAYSDLFGLVRVNVAQAARAQLKVLPRLHTVVLGETPRVLAPEEGVLSVLRRLPTDDHFRFRDYAAGDDTRRIHWKLSVKLGRLQVRLPETVPVVRRKVTLVLDNYLPAHYAEGDEAALILGDLLDRLVEVWLSLARALTERGEDVTLMLPTGEAAAPFTEVACRRGTQMLWRELGAHARWQSRTDLQHIALGDNVFSAVVTGRFHPLTAVPAVGPRMTWVFLPPGAEVPGPLEPAAVDARASLRYAFPAGAEENNWGALRRRRQGRRALERRRAHIAERASQGGEQAEAYFRGRGEPFYKVHRAGAAYVLDGR
ncbi:MAG: DUF58 domain-containing protein [Polyangiales bacterium]